MDFADTEGLARPGDEPRRLDALDPRRDRAGARLQRNVDPGATAPCIDIDLTSGFQLGQFSKAVSTSQTTSGSAAISIARADDRRLLVDRLRGLAYISTRAVRHVFSFHASSARETEVRDVPVNAVDMRQLEWQFDALDLRLVVRWLEEHATETGPGTPTIAAVGTVNHLDIYSTRMTGASTGPGTRFASAAPPGV